VGPFAGDKDAAAYIRDSYIRPTLNSREPVLLDFRDIELATQSFIHALIAAVIRSDPNSLDLIEFRGCNDAVREIIGIVVDYSQRDFTE
jgi:hypothetical protein